MTFPTRTEIRTPVTHIITGVDYQVSITEAHKGLQFTLSLRNNRDEVLHSALISKADLTSLHQLIQQALEL